jgi:hypothetical protein
MKDSVMKTQTNEKPISKDQFLQMARDIQQRRGCTFQDACRSVKHQYPEARAAFVAAGAEQRVPN